MRKNTFLKNKKAIEIVSTRILYITLGILVLIAAAFALTSPKILDSIRNLPGEQPLDNTEEIVTPDSLRFLNYEPVGKVVCGRFAWLGTRCNIYYLERKSITEQECKSQGYEWKTACYDTFGFISNDQKDANCAKYSGRYESACFDKAGFLVYDENYIPTILYWDYNRGDSYNGEIRILEGPSRHNSKVGDIKNNFLIFDDLLYRRADNNAFLREHGFTDTMKDKLNETKYLGGKLYKSK